MATDLWPIIHRLSHLQEAKRELQAADFSGNMTKATVLHTELESTSHAIELALTNWSPSILSCPSSPPRHGPELDLDQADDERLQSILNNAEAYRHSAFVYLYKDIQNLPRRSKKVQQHVKLALHACDRVVEWAGPMSALLWPLFVSSCEAVDSEDREMARRAFGGTER
jgi:Fungal specific transcription factor domain